MIFLKLKKYTFIDKIKYNVRRIYVNSEYEIVVITWDVNQHSGIHNHAENGCYMKVVQGELIENLYSAETLVVKQTTQIKESDGIRFIKDSIGYHSIGNAGNEVAVSVHVYSPPNHDTKYF